MPYKTMPYRTMPYKTMPYKTMPYKQKKRPALLASLNNTNSELTYLADTPNAFKV